VGLPIFTPQLIAFDENGSFLTDPLSQTFSKNCSLPVNLFLLHTTALSDFLLGFQPACKWSFHDELTFHL
jgi:hypothetical protein